MDFKKRCAKLRSALVYQLCMVTLIGAARIRFPTSKHDQTEELIPCNNSATLNFTSTEYVYNINGIPCSVSQYIRDPSHDVNDTSEAFLAESDWQNFNISWSNDPLQGSESSVDDVQILYESSTKSTDFQIVPVHGTPEQLISENEVISLQNQYRWIMDKPTTWKKRYTPLNNVTQFAQTDSNALIEAFKNKTKPIKPLSYEDQKGFQNEFLDILGKGIYGFFFLSVFSFVITYTQNVLASLYYAFLRLERNFFLISELADFDEIFMHGKSTNEIPTCKFLPAEVDFRFFTNF